MGIEKIFESLNANAPTIQALTTVALVFITGYYAWSTKQMVKEMKLQNRPYVFLDFDMVEGTFDLAVSNLGNRVAHNVRFEVIKDIMNQRGESLSSMPIIRDGISYFPPQRRFLFSFDYARPFLKDRGDCNLFLHFRVYYSDGERTYQDEFQYDLSIYKGMAFRTFSDLGAVIASGLNRIADTQRSARSVSVLEPVRHMQCPVCKELIKSGAVKCYHCGERIKAQQEKLEEKQGQPD